MNNRYIIDLLEEMKHNCLNGNIYDDPKRNDKVEALNYAIFCVERQKPTVDAEPVRHGYWIVKKTAIGAEYTICSECKTDFKFKTDKGTFARLDMRGALGCPNCRAKMDKEENENENHQTEL